ncbi:MAG TPA: ParB N-terminal domain-containing protein [Treponemataceae bacterium]|jgi:ParB-like chromosome segregation protein Spo0J|nr:ParB N-terminal domain-containing protein [Treponemataceae bacterium]
MKILKKINEQIQKTKLDKIKMMELSKLKLDPTYKDVFNQEAKKVDRIAEDMIENGFDKSQPIITTEDYAILDGNSRFIAAQKAGIKIVPIIIKKKEILGMDKKIWKKNFANILSQAKKKEGKKTKSALEQEEYIQLIDAEVKKIDEEHRERTGKRFLPKDMQALFFAKRIPKE